MSRLENGDTIRLGSVVLTFRAILAPGVNGVSRVKVSAFGFTGSRVSEPLTSQLRMAGQCEGCLAEARSAKADSPASHRQLRAVSHTAEPHHVQLPSGGGHVPSSWRSTITCPR